jgi:hypothetical protein
MDWLNNPRTDIEKRIKQLEARAAFLRKFRGLGSIDYENGVAARFYPSMTPKKMREKAGKLLDRTRKELDLKRKQLKNF